jgi:Retrotransposon gag protein/Zinc knuckle
MPITRATNPHTDNPSVTTNTTAPDPDTGGDLAAAIALLAQTLATQNTRPPVAQSAPVAPVTSSTRLREPDTFDGSDANKLRVFILQCSLHFQDRANAFSSGKAKVTYALSFLTGPALSWFEPALFDLAPPAWVDDWDLFRTELETNFGPFDPVGEAEAEIETLVMAEGSRSAIYFVEFNRLASRIQWDDHALLRQAYKGLARRIKNEMVHHDRPVTLLGLRKLVQAIDYRYWERKAEITREANPTSKVDHKVDPKVARNPEAAPKGKAPENPKSGPDLTGKLGKDGKLTPQERQRRMDNSLCLFCGKTGHIAKECPKSTAIAARARAAVAELQESSIEEAKKD